MRERDKGEVEGMEQKICVCLCVMQQHIDRSVETKKIYALKKQKNVTDWCLLQFYVPFHTSACLICKCEIRA